MPKVKLTANDRRMERFNKNYRLYKSMLGLTEDDVASSFGITRRALLSWRKNVVRAMAFFLRIAATWSDEEILAFVRGE